jgi:hypothetical protein
MIDENKIKDLVTKRADLSPDDDSSIEKYWKEISEMLSVNVDETIDFLDKCTIEEIYWISEVFDDISAQFQSQSFIEFLELLQTRYPLIDLSIDIECAKKALKTSI